MPWHPVYPDDFIGRIKEVEMILRYLPCVIKQGIPEHFFIIGKRGMGKTSFIQYVACIVKKEYNMIPVYINIHGLNAIEDLIINLLEALFKEFDKTSLGQNIIDTFCKRFSGINFEDLSFTFYEQPEIIANVKSIFKEFLIEICDIGS